MIPNWIIERLYVKPSVDGLSNVVINADWRCNGSETVEGKEFYGTCYGSCSFAAPDSSEFTDFDKLTKEQVLGWVWQSVSQEGVEASVANQIETQINPPIITPMLPWLQSSGVSA